VRERSVDEHRFGDVGQWCVDACDLDALRAERHDLRVSEPVVGGVGEAGDDAVGAVGWRREAEVDACDGRGAAHDRGDVAVVAGTADQNLEPVVVAAQARDDGRQERPYRGGGRPHFVGWGFG